MNKDSKNILDSLQGWWVNSAIRDGAGLHLVIGEKVYFGNTLHGQRLQVLSDRKILFAGYSGIHSQSRKEVVWEPHSVVWTFTGQLPDPYNPETKQGRFQYLALLGSGSYGRVFEARDMHT